MDLAAPDKDPARARREFTEIYLPARRNQEQLLTEFDGRVRRFAAAIALDWQRLVLGATAAVAILALAAALLARRM